MIDPIEGVGLGPWSYLMAPGVSGGLRLRLVDHDRSHYCPPHPLGHAACGQDGCANYQPRFYNGSDKCAEISGDKDYLCRIGDGWFMGTFHADQSDRWRFSGWYNATQLSHIWLVYEVIGLPTGLEVDMWRPPRNMVKVCTDSWCMYSDFTHPESDDDR